MNQPSSQDEQAAPDVVFEIADADSVVANHQNQHRCRAIPGVQ